MYGVFVWCVCGACGVGVCLCVRLVCLCGGRVCVLIVWGVFVWVGVWCGKCVWCVCVWYGVCSVWCVNVCVVCACDWGVCV